MYVKGEQGSRSSSPPLGPLAPLRSARRTQVRQPISVRSRASPERFCQLLSQASGPAQRADGPRSFLPAAPPWSWLLARRRLARLLGPAAPHSQQARSRSEAMAMLAPVWLAGKRNRLLADDIDTSSRDDLRRRSAWSFPSLLSCRTRLTSVEFAVAKSESFRLSCCPPEPADALAPPLAVERFLAHELPSHTYDYFDRALLQAKRDLLVRPLGLVLVLSRPPRPELTLAPHRTQNEQLALLDGRSSPARVQDRERALAHRQAVWLEHEEEKRPSAERRQGARAHDTPAAPPLPPRVARRPSSRAQRAATRSTPQRGSELRALELRHERASRSFLSLFLLSLAQDSR